MSQIPPAPAEPLNYQTVSLDQTPIRFVRLLVIFNFIMAGLDAIYGIAFVAFSIGVPIMLARIAARPGGAGAGGAGGAPPSPWLIFLMYGGMGLASLGVSVVKIVAAWKMLRHRPRAWGWGLAAGICGCTQMWCSLLCIVPLAAGIYTIVILCREDVRGYLHSSPVESVAR